MSQSINDRVYCFQGKTLSTALETWEADQITAYPHKETDIAFVKACMIDFLQSDHALNNLCVEQLIKQNN